MNPALIKLKKEIFILHKEIGTYFGDDYRGKSFTEGRNKEELKAIKKQLTRRLNWLEWDSGPGWMGGSNPYDEE